MPRLTIDGRAVEVAEGATVLEAAQALGIEIPTLCHLQGWEPSTSCLVCMVKVRGSNRLVPSCATKASEGLEIESESAEVHQVRKTALELLLSDHLGDCLAPCHFACPAHMNIPLMLRQIGADALREAIETIKQQIALPAVLGRVCPKPCEKGCRRHAADGAVAVCDLKRYAADADLASPNPYTPSLAPPSGKRVAIVGAGPTGLSAAYYLRRDGHEVVLLDEHPLPGGRLRYQVRENQLPQAVLDAEIAQVPRLEIDWRPSTTIATRAMLDDLLARFDAVLLAWGTIALVKPETGGHGDAGTRRPPLRSGEGRGEGTPDKAPIQSFGIPLAAHGVQIDKETFMTARPGLFAAGGAIRAKGLVVRSVADGKEVAVAISRYFSAPTATGVAAGANKSPATPAAARHFSVRMGKLEPGEIAEFVAAAGQEPRKDPPTAAAGYSPEEAAEQAGRCLHCDCRGLSSCKLRRYAEIYGADPARYRGQRARFQQYLQHSAVIYEPGKCINCGLCIQIAQAGGEPLGLTFVGRGFDVRVGVPFSGSMEQALSRVAAQCVAACPTSALALKRELPWQLPILGQ
jgi:NADPH-dependent glutamate synthase beta subunit-like oxidoreductase/ferredoxin/NAD-dependent dihydropyrimidine dehydrogenase PreA subunit